MSPLYTLLLGCIVIVAGTQEEAGTRDKKVFSLFSVVTFPNDVCTGKTGDTGTCQSTSECTTNSGTADGNCASGFGVCCTFSASACASTITQNTSYITNPTYPTAMTATSDTSCAYTVTPLSTDICQLRLDFVDFDIADKTDGSAACEDTFVVTSGSGRTYPTLCGTLTGQHLYTETGRVTSGQTLTFTIKATTGSGKWKILVRQIECSATWKAPNDCSQYYTGLSGRLISFNFGSGTQLWSQDLTLCIRREHGYCAVGYGPTQGQTTDTFGLKIGSSAAIVGKPAADEAAHISIPGGIPESVFSGGILAAGAAHADTSDAVIYQNGGFFGLTYQTTEASQASTTGFDLTYTQIPCALGVSNN